MFSSKLSLSSFFFCQTFPVYSFISFSFLATLFVTPLNWHRQCCVVFRQHVGSIDLIDLCEAYALVVIGIAKRNMIEGNIKSKVDKRER